MSNPEAPSSGRLGAARAPLSVLPAAAAIVLAAILVTAAGVRLGAQPSATPVFDWLFDDPVKATARVGNTLFVGGSFSKVVPQTGRVGTLVGLAPTTGTLVTAYPPYGDVIVPSPMALDGAGGYYAATETDVNGTFVRDIVHVRSDGSRDPAFTLGAIVKRGTYDQYPKITVVPSALIVTGSLQVGGVDRAIAAFDRATGAALPWAAVLPMSAFAVAQVASPARFFVLSYVTGAPTSDLHAFDLATGATVWHQALAPGSLGAMTLAGGRLIVGIAFNPLRAIDAGTGTVDPAWGATVTGHIFGDIVLSGTAIYASIDREPFGIKVDLASGTIVPWPATLNRFTRLAPSPTGGVFVNGPLVVGGQTRTGPVEIDAAGVATAWTPAIPGKVAGVLDSGELAVERDALQGLVVRPGLAAFDLTTGTLSSIAPVLGGPYIYIDQVLSDGQRVFFKGTFTSVNGQPRNGVAAIDGTTGALLDWPAPGVELSELAATDASHVYIYTAGALLRRLDSITS